MSNNEEEFMSYEGYQGYEQEEQYEDEPKKRRPVRMIIFGAIALVLIAALAAGGYLFSLARSFDGQSQKIHDAFPAEENRPQSTGAVNILLLGNDTRAANAPGENLASIPNGGRSDTMMLVHIPKNRKGVYVTSIMRDTWLNIPGKGEHKINAAFALGGVPLAVQTLEELLGTRIDHVASIDFESFKGLTDALGGVMIDNPIPFNSDQLHGQHFAKGPQLMDGKEALAFVRERHAFKDGDYQRVRNQQQFIKSVLGELLAKDTLLNPGRISDVVSEISPYIAVDDSLDALKIGQIAASMGGVRPGSMHFFTLPTKGTGRSPDGVQSIVVPDMNAIDDMAKALKNDNMAAFLKSHDL
ncbi:LCP family protein [Paeniglutamicibacter cryotolerans]|uniref:LCP family protein required for cell wall assembly n=1 Tax=Paeniglutamicibacter cryotolerans TaxID=670079 RepID=A0A839QRM7_9MICC|nr:LCP family protein [Paeniglutamicibacter cryotolerans]MBB2997434.1 LCP family protein required for cell wall assembly [Paeniglutamicibacter cryotolerans]